MSSYKYNPRPKNPWKLNQNQANPPKKQSNAAKKTAEQKFQEAQLKLQQAVQKHVKDYESSEEEEEIESDNVIGSILQKYSATGAELNLVDRSKNFLQDAFNSGASTCLICISSIKRSDEVWSCLECYCLFHLMCIQRWSKDTLVQQKLALADQVQVRQIKMTWGCPKCRHDYGPQDIPSEYRCFCRKLVNPIYEALLAPHSCGETCGKDLKPLCGHQCLLLCHPGPCPPCPKTVKVTCYCGSSPVKVQRCSNKEWSCGKPCAKQLSCLKHKCLQSCHPGECPSCSKKSLQKCLCGEELQLRDCYLPLWQCSKICGKPLSCGFHTCNEICHKDDCGECDLSKIRTCPCGKSFHQLPCTEDTPACGDTCEKVLECGQHFCQERCHKGKCMICVETVVKSCRCGLHTKEIQCKKLYLCETKCKQMKDCNKHPCNRKCCDGNCPPCEKICGRTLSCRKHSCASVCHRGPCYPCGLTESVSCNCGSTLLTVPCGKKSRTRPPKCNRLCSYPSECHHPAREPHRCHFGECPPCRQICHKSFKKCPHTCPVSCHSSVLVQIEGQKASTPCEVQGPQIIKKALPCPNCVVPVPVTCFGNHETSDWPCHSARISSCHRPCGRILACGNHLCLQPCHIVEEAPDNLQAGINCDVCENECSKERPSGCNHHCPKPCHKGACPPCKQMIRVKCHCGLSQPYIECYLWTSNDDKEKLQTCQNQCPKFFTCGHRCRSNCHSGECPNAELCKKKLKISCRCKRLKKEFSCETVRKREAVVDCNEECLKLQEEEKVLKQLENEKLRQEMMLKNQRELEQYEKKFQSKKRNRDRKQDEVKEDKGFWNLYKFYILGFIFCCFSLYVGNIFLGK